MLIAGIFLSLVLSVYFAGTETAFVVANRIRVEFLKRQGNAGAHIAYDFLHKPERFIITTLVGNNITIIVFSSLAALFLEPHLSGGTIVIVSTVFLLIFGEILPKTLFRERSDYLLPRISHLLLFFEYALLPLNRILQWILSVVFGEKQSEATTVFARFSRKDFTVLLQESAKVGVIDAHEQEIINRLFRLVRRHVKEIMIPRTEIVAVAQDCSVARAKKIFQQTGLSRLPVYEGDLDNIIGMISVHDLFMLPDTISNVTRKVIFVPETKSCYELFLELRKPDFHMAIVLDEYGGTSGLITLEDILEELFGEIRDEYDEEPPMWRTIDSGVIIIDGRAEIDAVNKSLKLNLPAGDYTTVAGLILSHLGKIPRVGEKISIPGFSMEIMNATRKKIATIKLKKENI